LADGANSKVLALNPCTAAWPIKQTVGVLPGVPTNYLQPTFITRWNSPSSWKHSFQSWQQMQFMQLSVHIRTSNYHQLFLHSYGKYHVPGTCHSVMTSKLHKYTCTSKQVKIQH